MPKVEKTYANIHHWFGLSYSAYAVFPRVILTDLPTEIQDKFLEVIEHIEENYDTDRFAGNFMVKARNSQNKFVKDPMSNYRRINGSDYRLTPSVTEEKI